MLLICTLKSQTLLKVHFFAKVTNIGIKETSPLKQRTRTQPIYFCTFFYRQQNNIYDTTIVDPESCSEA